MAPGWPAPIKRQCRGGQFTRYRIAVEGVVQGVGFRPFVKRLADRLGLPGIVFNTASGVVVEIESPQEAEARTFLRLLRAEAPSAAKIESCSLEAIPATGCEPSFRIVVSRERDDGFTLLSPDLATCSNCLSEIRRPTERRFAYPFTNCTNCGPRYSITCSTPYDRATTTMSHFEMCGDCEREYEDPADRRFHAEPIACPACGPQLSHTLEAIRGWLLNGQIVALKGLGGYQLACDGLNKNSVAVLRERKQRSRKPFALMMPDMATVERYCVVTEADRHALTSTAAPIVLLAARDGSELTATVAAGLREIGVMLPYTPLHHLLFEGEPKCLVMTSGNLSEEPIVVRDIEAHKKLGAVADQVVSHNREIFTRVDDSVQRVFEGVPRTLRRARGLAPRAIRLGDGGREVFATGAELKNTFCLTKGPFAIQSQHLGDLEHYETLEFFEETFRNLQEVYQFKPELIAHDLHPDYLGTRWASARAEPRIAIQHHHAHIASCMAENQLRERTIGVAFDGAGLGTDAQIWGGEFLLCDYRGFERCAHLRYVPLPGGDRAAREGWRMAAAYLFDAFGAEYRHLSLPCWQGVPTEKLRVVEQAMRRPPIWTSSCGRLFDAISAICGICLESSYEGEAAMLLEAAAAGAGEWRSEDYEMPVDTEQSPWIVDSRALIRQIAREVAAGRPHARISHCFHRAVARMIDLVCGKIRQVSGVNVICLSGGVFQNFTLLKLTAELLRLSGFKVFLHAAVPPNDGGISLGQAAIATAYLEKDATSTCV